MANSASLVSIATETRATLLAKGVSLGTVSDLIEASKQRPTGPESLAAWRDLVDDYLLNAYDLIKSAAAVVPLTGTGTWASDGVSYATFLDLGTIATSTAWSFTGEVSIASNAGGIITGSVIQFRGTARRSGAGPSVPALGVLTNGNQAGAAARSLVSTNNILLQALSSVVDTVSYSYSVKLTEIVPV